MKSYTTLRNLYTKLTNNSETTNLTLGDELINDGYRKVTGMYDWSFLTQTFPILTVGSTQFYTVPAYLSKPSSVTVLVGNQLYTPEEMTSRQMWDRLNRISGITSDYPQYWYYFNGQVGIYPTPATTSNTINVICKVLVKDLSIADYTIGSIVSVANGGTAVVGSGTTWTTPMAGRYIRITDSDTANKGDGFWYQIASVQSSTALTLTRAYGGTAIFAGTAAYTIGQMPVLPENYHVLPVYYAVAEYWSLQGETTRTTDYTNKYNTMLAQMIKEFASPSSGPVIDFGRRRRLQSPNLFITQP